MKNAIPKTITLSQIGLEIRVKKDLLILYFLMYTSLLFEGT